jgi:nucleoside-diphosphate-sugar epimerase
MRVLVTGGAGYLGALTAAELLDGGHRVTVLDSLLHGGEALLPLYGRDGFRFVQGDVRDAEAVERALEQAEGVVHLAAIVGDPACKREPDVAREVNHDASLALFDRVRALGADRFIFASTCSNYGRMADPESYVDETAELSPVSLYAETKVAVERALLELPVDGAGGPAITELRFATLYGLAPRMRFDLTVNEFSAELLSKRTLEVYGEQFWRPYVHVRDAARAIRDVLEADRERVAGEVFNVGDTNENYRKADLVELIRERLDGDIEIKRVEVAEDPRDYRVSFAKIEDRLGFGITRTVRDGIAEVLDAVGAGVIRDPWDPRWRNIP